MIGIINYGVGNLRSVAGAVERLEHEAVVTNDPEVLSKAEKLILPGVGAFGDGMKKLHGYGLVPLLTDLVLEKKKPILGICLGFQLMARSSEEFGVHKGLGWIDADVIRMAVNSELRLPHVGWNELRQTKESLLFSHIPSDALFYYVHSYHVKCGQPGIIAGECDYGLRFTASVETDNIFGTQFHPEKSQQWGLQVLDNFLEKA